MTNSFLENPRSVQLNPLRNQEKPEMNAHGTAIIWNKTNLMGRREKKIYKRETNV